MKSQLTALLGAVLVVGSAPLIAGEPFYTPGMHPIPDAAGPTSRVPASLDWTAMIGTGGKIKPASAEASTASTVPHWTSKIGAGSAADSNSGSKAPAKAPVIVAEAGSK